MRCAALKASINSRVNVIDSEVSQWTRGGKTHYRNTPLFLPDAQRHIHTSIHPYIQPKLGNPLAPTATRILLNPQAIELINRQAHLDSIADELNDRPRAFLGFLTPQEDSPSYSTTMLSRRPDTADRHTTIQQEADSLA